MRKRSQTVTPWAGRPAIVEAEPVALADVELLARLFRALGDARRLQIVELLLDVGELHQADIVRRLGLSQTRASEHLGCLVWCGFVTARAGPGRRTYYQVRDPAVADLVQRAEGFLADNEAAIASCRRINSDEKGCW